MAKYKALKVSNPVKPIKVKQISNPKVTLSIGKGVKAQHIAKIGWESNKK